MKNLEQLEQCVQYGDYKNLIAGTEIPPMIKGVYLKTGQGILQYGSVLAMNENDVAILFDKNTSEIPIGILAETVDTGKTEEETGELAQMYIMGVFNQDALLFAEGTTLQDIETKLTKIVIKKMYD